MSNIGKQVLDLHVIFGVLILTGFALLVGYKLGEETGEAKGYAKGKAENKEDFNETYKRQEEMQKFVESLKK